MFPVGSASILSGEYGLLLLAACRMTARLFAWSWVLGFLVAVVIAACRASSLAPLRMLAIGLVEYHRNTPVLINIFIWYFGFPQLLPRDARMWLNEHDAEFLFAVIALMLNVAAYMAEDIRSGIRTIGAHQVEAARAIGLTGFQTMKDVVLPQAIRASLPQIVNLSLVLFKATSIAMTIGVMELAGATRQISNDSFRTMEIFAIGTLIYLAGSSLIMGAGALLERLWPSPERRR